MAGAGTKRIVDLTEAPAVQSGDYIAIDSTARGTKKTPASVFAKAADLTAEQTARQQADEAEAQARANAISAEQTAREEADAALTESVTALSDEVTAQGALIQNPTKTVSGSIAHFTDGAEMPAKSVVVNIEPVQSGTGTPSPDNVRPISGWSSVNVYDTGKNLLEVSMTDGEVSGVTYTKNADGSISCNGTITGTGAKYIFSTESTNALKTGVAYVLTGGDEVSVDGIRVVTSIKNANGSVARWIDVTTASGYTFTLEEGQTLNTVYLRGAITGTAVNATIRPMIRRADDTDPTYEPYTGTNTTIPLGRTVYGGTLDVVSGVLTVYPFYPSYNGETLNGRWVCDRAVYAEGTTPPTGSQVALMSGTGTTYALTPTQINTLLGENNVWADAGAVEVTYRRDINLALEQLETLLNS